MSTGFPMAAEVNALGDFCEAATTPLRLIPHLLDKSFLAFHSKLDDDIHQQIQKLLDVGARKLAACGALLDEKDQLLKSKLAASCVNTGN
jgi:hypothetical protein